jgi:hypothetical protein
LAILFMKISTFFAYISSFLHRFQVQGETTHFYLPNDTGKYVNLCID